MDPRYSKLKGQIRQIQISKDAYDPATDEDKFFGQNNSILYPSDEEGGGGGSISALSAEVERLKDLIYELSGQIGPVGDYWIRGGNSDVNYGTAVKIGNQTAGYVTISTR